MVASADSPASLARLASVLRGSGVAVIPCDTIYGIVGAAPRTEGRIRAIKGRGEDKPFLQLIASASWTRRVCGLDAPPRLARHWPGPLTIVLPVVEAAGGAGPATVALRVPGAAWLRDMVAAIGEPLFSTSVNRAGSRPLWKIADIIREFEHDVDFVLDGGDLPGALPSTIVDATVRPFRVVRAGALAVAPEDLA